MIPHATNIRVIERIFPDGKMTTIFVVETKLNLDVDSPKFDQDAHHEMVEAIRRHLEMNPHLDSADIHSMG